MKHFLEILSHSHLLLGDLPLKISRNVRKVTLMEFTKRLPLRVRELFPFLGSFVDSFNARSLQHHETGVNAIHFILQVLGYRGHG